MNLQDLKQAGFSENEISTYISSTRNKLLKAGFSPVEIQQQLGTQFFDDQPVKDEIHAIIHQVERNKRENSAMVTAGKPEGLIKPGNIDLFHRPVLHNKDGSISTVRSITITDDNGKAVLLPTVGPQGEDWTSEQAIANWEKTGQNLGIFEDEKSADVYAQVLHEKQAEFYRNREGQSTDEDTPPLIRQGKEPSFWQRFLRSFEPNRERKSARAAISMVASEETGMSPSAFEPTMRQVVKGGLESSVSGLLYRGRTPEGIPQGAMAYLSPMKRLAMQLGTIVGDLPFMATGAVLGSEGGPLTTAGGAFALPAGMRKVLMDKYQKGEVKSFKDFWGRLTGAAWETLKGEATGVATAGAGGAVPGIARIPAEVGAMVTIGDALNGRVPELDEFIDAALLVGGMHLSGQLSAKLRTIYQETGKTPAEVVNDARMDPSVQEDLLSERKLPEVYGKQAQGTAPRPAPLEEDTTPAPGRKQLDEPAVARVISKISVGESKETPTTFTDLYTAAIDDLYPLKKIVQEMAGQGGVPTDKNPYELARLLRGWHGKAEYFLEKSPFRFDTYEEVGKPLQRILQPAKDRLDEFRAYVVSKRTLELEGRNVKTGIPKEDAEAIIRKYDGEFKPVFTELKEYQDSTLQYLKDAGLLSNDTFQAIKAANQDYVPFYRVMVTDRTGTGKGLEARQPIKKIRGSERDIVDPLESIIKNTYLYTQLSEKNSVGRALVDLAAGKEGLDKYVERIPTPVRPVGVKTEEIEKFLKDYGFDTEGKDISEDLIIFRPSAFTPKENVIAVWRDGKRELYKVHPDIARTFHALDRESINALIRLLSIPSRILRAGATLSPDFIARNPLRDQFSAFVYSKYGFVPGFDLIKGIYSMVKKDQSYWDWVKSGGMHSMLVSLDRRYLQKSLKDIISPRQVRNLVKNPLEALRILSELAEEGTRIGEFKKGIRKGASIREAGMASREVTLDFARIGAKTRAVNALIAFWNANIQGMDKMIRAFKENPGPTTLRVAAGITLPSILLTIVNRRDPRWKEIPQWEKDLFWIVMTKKHIWRIPKPFELGLLFGSLPERAVESILDKDPEAFEGVISSIGRGASPGVLPTVAIPLIEDWANKSFFTDRAIVPADREGLLPEYQYAPYTTETAKAIGSLIGRLPSMEQNPYIAPAKIENLIRGWSGGLGMYILNLADLGLQRAGVLPERVKPTPTLADIPIIKGFVVRHPSASAESIQRFYNEYSVMQMRKKTIKTLARKEFDYGKATQLLERYQQDMINLGGVYKALRNAHSAVEYLYQNPSIKPDEKRQLIDTVYNEMISIAREGNKMIKQMRAAQ